MGRRTLETDGREDIEAERELRFSSFTSKLWQVTKWQEEECCQVNKAEDLG